MQADPACTTIEELLIHSEWIQRLARRLVADPDAANDIIQETWLVAPTSPDWRWGTSGETTPWYPSMRILRTDRRGDWTGLLDQTRRNLRARVRGG